MHRAARGDGTAGARIADINARVSHGSTTRLAPSACNAHRHRWGRAGCGRVWAAVRNAAMAIQGTTAARIQPLTAPKCACPGSHAAARMMRRVPNQPADRSASGGATAAGKAAVGASFTCALGFARCQRGGGQIRTRATSATRAGRKRVGLAPRCRAPHRG